MDGPASVHPGLGMVPVERCTLSHELLDSLQRRLCRMVEYKAAATNVRVLMVVDSTSSTTVTGIVSAQISVAGRTLWHYYYASASPHRHLMKRISGYEGPPEHLALTVPHVSFDPDASLDPVPTCGCVPRPSFEYANPVKPMPLVPVRPPPPNKCPFLAVPREVRNCVYRWALAQTEAALDLSPNRASAVYIHSRTAVSASALFLVNRQVHVEFTQELRAFCLTRPLLVLTVLGQKWKPTPALKAPVSHYVVRLAYPPLNLRAQLDGHIKALWDDNIRRVHLILLLMPMLGEAIPRSTQDVMEDIRWPDPRFVTSRLDGLEITFTKIVRYRLEHYYTKNDVVHRQASGFVRYATLTSLAAPHALERDAFVTSRHCLRSDDIGGLIALLRDFRSPSETEGVISALAWKHTVLPTISTNEMRILERSVPIQTQSSAVVWS